MKYALDTLISNSVRTIKKLPPVSLMRKTADGKRFTFWIKPPDAKAWSLIMSAVREQIDASPFKLSNTGECSAEFIPK